MSFGLVLGGGGTRGSYHIGAYKALLELSKTPKVIVGTSIGAINGAIIAQGDFLKLSQLWENISMEDVLKTSEALKKSENLFDIKNTTELIKEIYQNKGIDATPLKQLIDNLADEEKLKASPVDFALVTFSISDKKEVVMTKQEIPENKLTDYLLASAGFPGLKPVKIEDTFFMDGGVTNNIPISILADRDIDDIAVIDVGGVGIIKDADISGKNIITVRAESPLVGIMDFNRADIRKNTQYGYFDTLKAFGKCVGKHYYIDSQSFYKSREFYGSLILEGLEEAALAFGINLFKIYTVGELISGVCMEYRITAVPENVQELIKNPNEKNIICSIARAIIMKNSDFFANKMVTGLLGSRYMAANAIAYFCKK